MHTHCLRITVCDSYAWFEPSNLDLTTTCIRFILIMMCPLTQAFITRGCGHLYRSLRLPSHVVRHLFRHRDAWVVPWFDPRAQRCSCWPWHSCGSATQVERSGSTCCAKLKGVTTNTTRDLHRLGSITLLQATATYRCIREHSILRSKRRTQTGLFSIW